MEHRTHSHDITLCKTLIPYICGKLSKLSFHWFLYTCNTDEIIVHLRGEGGKEEEGERGERNRD